MKIRSSIIHFGVLSSAVFVFAPACGSDSGIKGGGTGGAPGATGGSAPSGGAGNSPGTAGNTGPGGTVGTGGLPAASNGGVGVTPGTSALGKPCSTAADCGTGLMCLTPMGSEFDGGGVPHGLCTLDCSSDINAPTPAKCTPLGATAICLQITNTTAYCVESCNLGQIAGQSKCHNRSDMACTDPGGVGIGYCQPTCRGDFDCAGRTCDLGTGVCTGPLAATRKLPIGAKCDPKAMNDICSGACVGVTDGATTSFGFCSGSCRLGEIGCGIDPATTGVRDSYCLFGADPAADFGDLGFCTELCDCNDDCASPDFVCSPVKDLFQEAGHAGACGPPDSSGDASMGIPCRDR